MSEKIKRNLDTEKNLLGKDFESRSVKSGKPVPNDGYFILLCAIAVNIFTFLTGCGLSWTSPVILKLYSNDTGINPLGEPINKLQESLIAGMPFLGSLIGPLLSSTITDIYGRKKVLAVFGGGLILSFILLAIGSTLWIYYLARFLFGLGFSIAFTVAGIYMSEITSTHNRGRYGAMIGMFVPLGNLYAYVIGPMFSVRMFSFLCVLPCLIIYPFFLLFVPDSPSSLVSNGEVEKAGIVLQKFRNSGEVEDELKEIVAMVKKHQITSGDRANLSSLLRDPVAWKAFKISCGIFLFQIFTGMIAIIAFVGPIFDTVNAGISGNVTAILVGLVKFSTFALTTLVVEKLKRKTLLMFSTMNASLCLFMLGGYFYLKETNMFPNIQQYSWAPVVCVLSFIVFYAIGIGPIPIILMGELFSSHFKSVAISFIMFGITIGSFVVSFSFRYIIYYCGTYVVFWIFTVSCFVATFFVYFVIPETKGKSLLEIQQMLDKSIK